MATSVPGSRLLPVAVALFAIGVLAICAVMVLFAVGRHDLPLWLNLTCLAAPAGLIVGVLGIVVRSRRG